LKTFTSESDKCKTVYPIVLVHGMGVQDNNFYLSWGRIPRCLRENGAAVFYGNTEAFAPIKDNAQILRKRIDEILAKTGAKKVNIIAHSKGGIDARYAISSLKVADKVASLTTIASPHNGSLALDFYCSFPRFLQRIVAFFPDVFGKITGDKKSDFFTVTHEISAKKMAQFNTENPDVDGVYYQSFALLMANMFSDITMTPQYLLVRIFDGQNDGLLSPKSVEWTNFRGVIRSATNRGISHNDGVDFRRRRLCEKKTANGYSDIVDFYIELAEGLKKENC
jgi:triacylglycerol lipase